MRIVGLDLSLTASGVAVIDGDAIRTGVVKSTGRAKDTYAQRHERITGLAARVHRAASDFAILDGFIYADLYVVEGPAISRNAGSAWDRAGLWWTVVGKLYDDGRNVAVVPPNVRAKWATNRGNADKASVAVTVARMCPNVELVDDNAADALCLALMGMHALGLRDEPKYRCEALLSAVWPEHIAARLLEPYEVVA